MPKSKRPSSKRSSSKKPVVPTSRRLSASALNAFARSSIIGR